MANTFSKIYFHVIFAVQNRLNLISSGVREEMQKYISGIVTNKNQKLISICCMPDHTHILLGLKPDIAVSTIVRDIKANSSRFINEYRLLKCRFNWQEGFGVFSCGEGDLDRIIHYITNQEYHHKKRNFKEEYIAILQEYNVAYNEEYLFKWIAID
ncbi:MAG: IS200/IS605 family transposase [Bacteroidota bacterium]